MSPNIELVPNWDQFALGLVGSVADFDTLHSVLNQAAPLRRS